MRRTPLAARTPLHRGKPLERKSPLLARKPLEARTVLRPGTPRRAQAAAAAKGHSAARSFPPRSRKLIDRRDSDHAGAEPVRLCQRCGTAEDPQRHHRRGKQKGGSHRRPHTQCPCNGITLCGPGGRGCHQWAHAHPEQARAEGFIVSQSVNAPGSAGVMRFAAAEGGATQWPSCSGGWLETAAEALEAA